MTLLDVVFDDRADRLVLSSQQNRNALSATLLGELISGLRKAAASSSRALVLDHVGKAFCSGVDLRERATSDGSHSSLLATLLRELWQFPKPVIARVDGVVRGGGMALLACSDLVVAGETSNFGYSEVRVGVAPALVAAVTFPRLSTGLVAPLMITGRAFGAAEAHKIGLVTRVVAVGDPVTVEPELDSIARGGPGAVALTKRLIRQPMDAEVLPSIDAMERVSREIFESEEAVEGMKAFAERRPPAWQRP